MASVTQLVPHYLGGVSKQQDDKKLPGQVRECINAYPEPTFGLIKRPGFEFLHTLDETTGGTDFDQADLDNAKWFYINRTETEKYVGCIKGHGTYTSAAIHIWRIKAGAYTKCAITYPENGVSGYDGRKYIDQATRDDYHVLTVQDVSYVTNKTKSIEPKDAPTYNADRSATVQIKSVDYSSEYKITVKSSGGGSQSVSYQTQDLDNFSATVPASGSVKLNAKTILAALKTSIDALSNYSAIQLQSSLEITNSAESFSVTVEGGPSNEAMVAFSEEVETLGRLPDQSKDGRLVKIVNTESADDTYWTKFIAEDGVSGSGHWSEWIDPTVSVGLKPDTMPHELVNTAENVFQFRPVVWTERLVGDDTTNSHPSFVNEVIPATSPKTYNGKIQQTFFHNNRLGFLTGDNVSMSQSGEFNNFYHISARAITASDPVDLSCSSIRPATLHAVIPTIQGLLLFSETAQYIMFADNGVLTPTTTIIRGISNYEIDRLIDPVESGTTTSFLSKTPGYTRVFRMQTKGQLNNPTILDIGKVVAEWIPDTVTGMISSPQNDFIALYGDGLSTMYFFRTYDDGEKIVLQSWFKWELPGNVLHAVVDNDDMYLVIKAVHSTDTKSRYHILKTSLTLTPENPILTTQSGKSINPYMDMYVQASNVTYSAADGFSKCLLPYVDRADLTPVIIIKGDASAGELAGYTLSPERGADGAQDWFKIPGEDWSASAGATTDPPNQTKDRVYVGYKYNYDIELPKTYFQLNQSTYDYTAALTLSRMKFSVGLSSVIGFKVTRKGRHTPYHEWTGDGSETEFDFNFDYNDVNDLKVKVNGVLTTAYTISDKTLTMTTAPPDGQTLLLYTDTWYDIQTVKDAGQYLSDDVPLAEQSIFTLPIHDRTDNFSVRVFSDSPFPVSLTSMMWEGVYSPRYYRRVV